MKFEKQIVLTTHLPWRHAPTNVAAAFHGSLARPQPPLPQRRLQLQDSEPPAVRIADPVHVELEEEVVVELVAAKLKNMMVTSSQYQP